ncbi:MAG: hypothetical protein ACI828_002729, partial [Flavobacteriales bacterium]
ESAARRRRRSAHFVVVKFSKYLLHSTRANRYFCNAKFKINQ